MADSAEPPPAPPPAPTTRNPLKRLYLWVLSWADHPHGTWALFGLSTAESVIFPIPPDLLLIPLVLGRREKALWFALVCTIGSLLGAALGYLIGMVFWEATSDFWLNYVFGQEKFDWVGAKYNEWGAVAIFAAAFTFIPFKVFTVTAGVFGLNFPMFMIAGAVGRAGRFFIVALIFRWIGPSAKPFIDRWFNWLALALVALLVLGFWLLGKLG